MKVAFDPAKDAINVAKHGISLSRALDLDIAGIFEDDRFDYGEVRYRAFGFIDGASYCLAFTVRGDEFRAISLRRSRRKEMKHYVP